MNRSQILSAILKQLSSRPSFETIGVGQYRNLLDKSARVFRPDPSILCDTLSVDNLPGVWLTPENHDDKRVILYIHGGGFIAGSIRSHKDLAARIAKSANAKTLLFEYRLAPEHPFPAGFDDVQTAYDWILSTSDTRTISLVADSAGCSLALALMVRCLELKKPLPACAVFISPWLDLECKNSSFDKNSRLDPMLSRKLLLRTARLYTDTSLSDPMVSPINNSFTGLCPLLIQTGENEVLVDDSRLVAKKIKPDMVTLEIWEQMFHVWHYFAKYLPQGREAIEKIGRFILQNS